MGAAFGVLSVVAAVLLIAGLISHASTGVIFVPFMLGWLLGMTYLHFVDWDCVLDGRHDLILVRGRSVGKLSDAVSARYDSQLFTQSPRSRISKKLYLKMADGRNIELRILFVTKWEDAGMSTAAVRMSAFLAERAARTRQEQNGIGREKARAWDLS